MKLLIKIILIAVLALLLEMFMPWWSIALAAFAVELAMGQPKGKAFAAGFLGVFILWFAHAFIIDMQNEHILAGKVANILPMGGSIILLIVVTAFIGGLVGGLAAATGRELKRALVR
ncbi:MAG: hypothetical protein M0D57_06250 [Sphingobacteriales bacterium JAD_PAG50586_3]|nr:MAG: hypothetical protein M0D57_06250 [Sphingobacteriales bacterium JAD_PAG50586_3]